MNKKQNSGKQNFELYGDTPTIQWFVLDVFMLPASANYFFWLTTCEPCPPEHFIGAKVFPSALEAWDKAMQQLTSCISHSKEYYKFKQHYCRPMLANMASVAMWYALSLPSIQGVCGSLNG